MKTSTTARTLWRAAACAVGVRGARSAIATARSKRWLTNEGADGTKAKHDLHFVMILPLLREQAYIEEVVFYFANLCRLSGQADLALVTTERETTERLAIDDKIQAIATALSKRRSISYIRSLSSGVLPTHLVEQLYAETSGSTYEACLRATAAYEAQLPSTRDLGAALANRENFRSYVRHYHYPFRESQRPDQINFAAKGEIDRLAAKGVAPEAIYVAVYDADSRPERSTLEAVKSFVSQCTSQGDQAPEVMQQSSVYFNSYHSVGAGFRGAVLNGCAFVQSRWSLAFEIPRLRRQSASCRSTRPLHEYRPLLGHCAGHGMYVRGDTYVGLNGLNALSVNDDMDFGYRLSVLRIPINPIPALDHSEMPASLSAVIRQKRRWFWSCLLYPEMRERAMVGGMGTNWVCTKLAVDGVLRGIVWLGTSPCVAAASLAVVLEKDTGWRSIALGAVGLYTILPAALLKLDSRYTGLDRRTLSAGEVLGCYAACLIESIGPWWACYDALKGLALRRPRYTPDKTER